MHLMLSSPLTYAVYPWSVHCKCAMKWNQSVILTSFIFGINLSFSTQMI